MGGIWLFVVNYANDLGNMVRCVPTSKNQIYSRCTFTIKIKFTVSRLDFQMVCLVFQQNFKYRIIIRIAQRCGSYGGQHLAMFHLTYSLINFRKLSFSGKKLLSAINQKILSFLEMQVYNSSKSDYNRHLFEIWRVCFPTIFKGEDQNLHIICTRYWSWYVKAVFGESARIFELWFSDLWFYWLTYSWAPVILKAHHKKIV
jgi:hypothetical protein